jgi:hypothetical protein
VLTGQEGPSALERSVCSCGVSGSLALTISSGIVGAVTFSPAGSIAPLSNNRGALTFNPLASTRQIRYFWVALFLDRESWNYYSRIKPLKIWSRTFNV